MYKISGYQSEGGFFIWDNPGCFTHTLITFLICDVCSSAVFLQHLVKGVFGCVAAVACGMMYAIYLSTYHDRKFWFSTRQVGECVVWVCSYNVYHTNSKIHLCVSGTGAWTHLPRRQWALLLLLQTHADCAVIWKRHVNPFKLRKEICKYLTKVRADGNSGSRTPNISVLLSISSALCWFFFPGFYELTVDNKTVSGQTVNIVQRLSLYPELIASFIYRVTSSDVSDFHNCILLWIRYYMNVSFMDFFGN